MQPLDLEVVSDALRWLEQGRPTWLCTVLATYGSAPRGPGSMLAYTTGQAWTGSLSGGCVEDDLIERLPHEFTLAPARVIRYGAGGLTPRLELPCGGSLDILIEQLNCTHIAQRPPSRRHCWASSASCAGSFRMAAIPSTASLPAPPSNAMEKRS